MNMRTAEISRDFAEWLERRSCPTDLRDKPEAARREADALLKALLKFAPQTEFSPFVRSVLEQLDFQMKTRFWPAIHDVAAVCTNVRKEISRQNPKAAMADDRDMRPEAITARAMMEGKPVGEGWLYGRDAVAMIAAKLIDKATMDAYRSGAFFARRDLYGEAAALAWEAEAKARHEDAKAIHREAPADGRDTSVPDKRVLREFAA